MTEHTGQGAEEYLAFFKRAKIKRDKVYSGEVRAAAAKIFEHGTLVDQLRMIDESYENGDISYSVLLELKKMAISSAQSELVRALEQSQSDYDKHTSRLLIIFQVEYDDNENDPVIAFEKALASTQTIGFEADFLESVIEHIQNNNEDFPPEEAPGIIASIREVYTAFLSAREGDASQIAEK